jgi:hypothetical protein
MNCLFFTLLVLLIIWSVGTLLMLHGLFHAKDDDDSDQNTP